MALDTGPTKALSLASSYKCLPFARTPPLELCVLYRQSQKLSSCQLERLQRAEPSPAKVLGTARAALFYVGRWANCAFFFLQKAECYDPLSNDLGSNQTVEAVFWPWLSGRSPLILVISSTCEMDLLGVPHDKWFNQFNWFRAMKITTRMLHN